LGWVLMVCGIILIIGVASGGKDPLQPLSGLASMTSGSGHGTVEEVHFRSIKSITDLEREVAQASTEHKPVMLDFYADWCISCKEMERYTFSDPDVRDIMEKGVLLQADVTANDEIDQALLKRFGLIGPPSILYFSKSGQELPQYRLVGFMKADEFEAHTRRAFAVN